MKQRQKILIGVSAGVLLVGSGRSVNAQVATMLTARQPAGSLSVNPLQTVPAGYIHSPNGWIHPSCIHEVPNGATIDAHDNVIVNGEVIASYPPCPYPPIKTEGGATRGFGYSGWVIDTSQQAPAGEFFDDVYGFITVPPIPTDQTGGTLGYFQALTSSAPNNNCGILQPVLQWGPSPSGGGEYWAFSSWWWSVNGFNNGFHTGVFETSPGRVLFSQIYLTDASTNSFNVIMFDETSANETIMTASELGCTYDQEYQTLEVPGDGPNGGQISNCNQVPSQTQFNSMFFAVGTPSNPTATDQISFAPTFNWPIGFNSPNCDWWFAYDSDDVALRHN